MYYYLQTLTGQATSGLSGNSSAISSASISSSDIFFPLLTIIATYMIARFVDRTLFRLEYRTRAKKHDYTALHVTRSVIFILIYFSGLTVFIYLIPPLRNIAFGLFAGVSILGIVLAYSARNSLACFLSGLVIVTFQPFRIGDRINVGSHEGYVEDINLRHTIIRNWQNNRIILPNQLIGKSYLSNFSIHESEVIEYIDIGISRESDIELARKIMLEEAQKDNRISVKTVESTGELVSPSVNCHGILDNSMHLRLTFWGPSKGKSFAIKYSLYEKIKARFDCEGISIPFDHRNMVYKDAHKNRHPKHHNVY